MENLSLEEFNALADEKKYKYEKIMAYAGIAEHQLLSVMRNYLVDRPQDDVGDLYKPLISVHNNFKQTAPDWAEAQLLCNKPSSVGLVYPRFDEVDNVLSVEDALERLLGDKPDICTFEYLKQYILDLGIPIIGGADWGFSDYTSMNVLALIPNGDIWYMTNHTSDNMEIDDIVKIGKELQNAWNVQKWYCDQNYPAYLKTLRKNGLKCPKFTKVVEDGIAALQSKIVDSDNRRRFFIIDVPENKFIINAFSEYRWKTDGKGDIVEGKPEHGTDGTSDVLDAIRYPFQNMYARGAKPMIAMDGGQDGKITLPKGTGGSLQEISKEVNKQLMQNQIKNLTGGSASSKKKDKSGKNGKIYWKL